MLGSLALPPSGSTRTVALPYPAHDGLPDRPRGVVIGGLAGIDEVVLPIRDTAASGIAVAVVPVGRLSARSVAGLDPAYDLVEVEPTGSPAVVAGEQSWDRAAALGRRLLASELVGVGRAALTLASTHVTDRTQFGRPIGSFQAVRHRLAEAHVHLSAAADLVDEAWHSGLAQDATVAKIVAGRAADATVRASMQVCGAIGLTWEHALHRHVRRAGVLDLLLDGADRLETRLGAELAEKRR
jgi:hypothetical protein